jgi:hypothetical protein
MSLIGNYRVLTKDPGRSIGGELAFLRSNWNKPTFTQARFLGDNGLGNSYKTSKYSGYVHPYTQGLALKDGGLASFGRILGDGNVSSANLAGGRNAQADLTGSGDITNAQLGLIISAIATLTGSGTLAADATGKLEAAATLAGTGDIVASLQAIASLISDVTGQATLNVDISAQGSLSADINVTGDLLTTANVASSVWGALASAFNDPNTMGALLNAAGGGSSPEIIADIILRRTTANVEASVNGDPLSLKSLYGMISQGVHNTQVSGSTLTVTKSDDSTVLGTRTVTTSASAEPIIGIDSD